MIPGFAGKGSPYIPQDGVHSALCDLARKIYDLGMGIGLVLTDLGNFGRIR